MKKASFGFWLIVVAQVAFLLSWAAWHEHVRAHGPEILLKAHPVDPRDLLRGDYMTLGYAIADVETPAGLAEGKACWVVLAPDGKYFSAVRASVSEPEPGPGQLAVRGTVGRRGVLYGIENYYVPEGKGSPKFETIEVEVAVSPAKQLYIRRVLLDGKAYP